MIFLNQEYEVCKMTNINELPTVYNPQETEKRIYELWEEKDCFRADANSEKPPYSIVIPPPNVTGVLHIGHALDNTLQDILIRYHRMSGYETLWLPGTDHAGIATQNVVEKKLREEGKTRHDLGREKFLETTWKWANEHKSAILDQFKRLGVSFDRSRERFTLDKGCSDAVKEVFVKLYEKDLIYKGAYIVNWCPRCQSAISDIETEYETEKSHLWEIQYPLKNERGAIVVATTRPETIFGDVAIAVNPNDYKYKDLIGKTVCMPLTGKEIPIIADEYVDKSFGTGAVKITPAHDPNDYEVGKRHNLKPVWVIDEKGCMIASDDVPSDFHNLDRFEARTKIIEKLKANGQLVRITDHEHNVGKCQRCNTTIEPLLSEQWFVRTSVLAKAGIEAVEKGELKFVPERWTKNFLGWMSEMRDWCISRQLWWGHQIPAYYNNETGEMVVAKENPDPSKYTQETDVLDTWFSSGLWPFSTMGWPNTDAPDFKKFYPTSVLVTAFDIIFFWVARMVMMGYEFTKQAPFPTVFIHGLIRDENGQKMSKSKGNTIDPVLLIDKYGCDAMRFTLTSLCTYGGQDIKISEERFEYGRNFANKIWNASRFVLMNLEGVDDKEIEFDKLTIIDKWILHELNKTAKTVNEQIKTYRIGEYAQTLYDFFRSSYCDKYVEIAKVQLADESLKANTQRVLRYVTDMTMRLLHPVMPHITEEIRQLLPGKFDTETIMKDKFPTFAENLVFDDEAEQTETVFETVKSLRNVRQSFNVPVKSPVNLKIEADEHQKEIFKKSESYIKRLAKVEKIEYIDNSENIKQSASAAVGNAKLIVPLAGLIDLNQEIARQNKKLDKILKEKSSLEGRMNNKNFTANAPQEVLEQTKNRIDELKEEENTINELIKSLQA